VSASIASSIIQTWH